MISILRSFVGHRSKLSTLHKCILVKTVFTTRSLLKVLETTMDQTKLNLNWKVNCNDIENLTKNLIDDTKKRCDQIVSTEILSNESFLIPLNEMERIFEKEIGFIKLLSDTSPDKNIRDACNNSLIELSRFAIELRMRKDLFDMLQKFNELNLSKLDDEAKRYVERSLLEGKQDGLHLNEDTRNRVKELRKKLSDLQLEFAKNINEENKKFPFKQEELAGVPNDLLNNLEKNEKDEYIVTLKYPVYVPIMKFCTVPSTRKKLYIEFNSRCINTNTSIFEEILQLRHQLANLLGYKNFAEYALELCMAKTPTNVEVFLNSLSSKLKLLLENELNILLKYKKEDCQKRNIPFDGKINQSDVTYYSNIREQLEFKIDQIKLQQYFPLDVVMEGVFEIYQRLLGLQFEYVKDAVTYHDEVKLYQVKDKESQEPIGYFYADMHPREGKYGHAAVFPIIGGCQTKNNERQLPVCAMVCNFTRPTKEKPALLTHDEVRTLFHEFGHACHHICAKANFSKFNGLNVELDFVETPSQMLENWVWEKESLKLMSKHYKDGTPIDESLLEDLVKSKTAMAGHFNLRQILFATIDQIFHQNPKSNTKEIYQKYLKKFLLMDIEDNNMNMVASFAHLAGGYEAKYYSYLWSEVYSQDIFDSRFKKEGILNPKTGMDYRRCILQPGGSKDGNEMLFEFLGREPTTDAFLRSKGLKD